MSDDQKPPAKTMQMWVGAGGPPPNADPSPVVTASPLDATRVLGPAAVTAEVAHVPGPPPAGPAATAVLPAGHADPTSRSTESGPGGFKSLLDYDAYVGHELCGYRIIRKLAEGGMGVVFEGVHTKIGRRGAIKLLKVEFCRSEEVIERFYQEARAVNAIRHENIVDIYDFGRDAEGRVFFVMEYLEGESLAARLQRGPLRWSEAFPILEQTLRALKAAHDKGFVHRDLKPDNIWLKRTDAGLEIKLLDFGITKLVGTESPKEKLTQTGSLIGTPHYMSPEQINGAKDIDQRTDVYAMGVIMYEMFAGVTPFVGESLQSLMIGHLFNPPPRLAPPAELGVPAPIADIIERTLAKEPAARYPGVADLLADLRDVNLQRAPARIETLRQQRPLIAATPAPVVPGARRRWTVAIGLTAGVAMAAGVGGIAYRTLTTRDAAGPVAQAPTPTVPTTPTTPPAPPVAPVDPPLDYEVVRKNAQTTLRASLAEAEPAVRVQGADAIGSIKDEPSVPTLLRLTEQDPDLEVRGHTADALGALGAVDASPVLARLEKAAPPALGVWYASALARLGDKQARKRLLAHARNADLEVSFRAGLTIADISQPGDKDAIKALRGLAAREAELNAIVPYAGAVILTKLAGLRDAQARKVLYSVLESTDEGARLAAAEGLARLGDDGGKTVLEEVLANQASPNRLVGAVALIPLGGYGGFDLISAKLDDKDPETRRLAARALGDIGERKSLAPLIARLTDPSWSARIAAAAAILAIVGLDPQVLAQASIDWTRSALGSQDWAVRQAAAGVLGDMPEPAAMPLLAQAIADPEPRVRLAASRSAGRMKGADAATQVARAARAEQDPQVKEQQVRALGAIGHAAARDALVELVAEPGRVGVFAAGSLIAVGDLSGQARLDQAVLDRSPDIRLAAMQAASAARNPIVVATLMTGVGDKVFDVRFTAAEGLAGFGAEKVAAMPVLESGLASRDVAVLGRAYAALVLLGESPASKAPSPAQMLESIDPKLRLAAVAIASALPVAEAAPLLRRLLADANQDVRRATVDAIEAIAAKDAEQAIRLYKPLVNDDDAVVRAKAQGQLARLVPAATTTAVVTPPALAPDPVPALPAPPDPTPAPADDAQARVEAAAAAAAAAVAELTAAVEAHETLARELDQTISQASPDDDVLKRAEALAADLEAAAARVADRAAQVDAAATAVEAAAGTRPAPAARTLVETAGAAARDARKASAAVKTRTSAAARKARSFAQDEADDAQMLVTAADAAIASGNLGEARRNLDRAAHLIRNGAPAVPGIQYSHAQLWDKLAAREKDPAGRLALLQKAKDAYLGFARSGGGARAKRAQARADELAEEITELGQP